MVNRVKQYLVYAKLWFSFSLQGLRPSVKNVVEFLTHLHSKGYSHDQISSARSAVAVICPEDDIGKHPDVKRLMKGIFEKNPTFPRYETIWDVRRLLDYLRSLPHQDQLPLDLLSRKLATLLGILSGGQRCQTIHAIDVNGITVAGDRCIIPIYSIIKQSKKGKHMRPLEFRMYPSEEKLCVLSNLNAYLTRTNPVRSSSKLFISYRKPHRPVTKDTITRWVNQLMAAAGIDINKHVTHSCRAAASSKCAKRKIPIKKILQACGWASESTFRNHYLKDVELEDQQTVAEHMLD